MKFIHAAAIAILLGGTALAGGLYASRTGDTPSVAIAPFCHSLGAGNERITVAVVGESWAAKGMLTPELPQTINKLTGKPVSSCQIGYSGRNTRQQIESFSRDYPDASLRRLFDGNIIDYAVIMTGVNDVVSHRGSEAYAEDTMQLKSLLERSARKVIVMEIPRINTSPPSKFLSQVKHRLYYFINDYGISDAVAYYNDALKARNPDVSIIRYRPFFRGYEQDGHMMKPDQVHLTDESFHKLGTYIGSRLACHEGAACI